jgi:hypothetical protein
MIRKDDASVKFFRDACVNFVRSGSSKAAMACDRLAAGIDHAYFRPQLFDRSAGFVTITSECRESAKSNRVSCDGNRIFPSGCFGPEDRSVDREMRCR